MSRMERERVVCGWGGERERERQGEDDINNRVMAINILVLPSLSLSFFIPSHAQLEGKLADSWGWVWLRIWAWRRSLELELDLGLLLLILLHVPVFGFGVRHWRRASIWTFLFFLLHWRLSLFFLLFLFIYIYTLHRPTDRPTHLTAVHPHRHSRPSKHGHKKHSLFLSLCSPLQRSTATSYICCGAQGTKIKWFCGLDDDTTWKVDRRRNAWVWIRKPRGTQPTGFGQSDSQSTKRCQSG